MTMPGAVTPTTDGWASVTGAINSMRSFDEPMALAVTSPDFGTLWIDFPRSRYYIDRPLDAIPLEPRTVALFSQQIAPGEELFPWVEWQPIDPLLWRISRAAFGGRPAYWLRAGDRYRLIRWPNLTQLTHTAAEIRILAALGSGQPLSVAEAAAIADASEAEVQTVINALSLGGGVEATMGSIVPPPIVEEATRRAAQAHQVERRGRGLLGRLRSRLGVAHG